MYVYGKNMKIIQAKNRREWRNWLHKNHDAEREIWLAYYKKHTGKPSVTYEESVEEAICFGWIDGIKKRLDDERYMHRFTPRRPKSKWSPRNIEIARKMIRENKMSDFGRAVFEQRAEYDREFNDKRAAAVVCLPEELEEELKKRPSAWEYFNTLPPGHRKQYILWITGAKKEETKQKRLLEALRLLEQKQKLGMK